MIISILQNFEILIKNLQIFILYEKLDPNVPLSGLRNDVG